MDIVIWSGSITIGFIRFTWLYFFHFRIFFAVVTILYDQLQAIVHAHDYDIVNVLLKYVLQQRYTVLWFMTCLYLSE